jgi:glycosyltransferase involved in cell wall biosynthesis
MTRDTASLNPQIAVVVPTCNRPKHVQSIIDDLHFQTLVPTIIIVVDSSDSDDLKETLSTVSQVVYIRSKLKSAAYQRNLGLREILEHYQECKYVSFIDDDIRINETYLQELSYHLIHDYSLAGVSGISQENFRSKKLDLERSSIHVDEYFYRSQGTIDKFVINRPVRNLNSVKSTTWLIGCSLWRISSLRQSQTWFEADFTRQSLFEDAIFSHRVSHHYELAVDTRVVFQHLLESSERPSQMKHGADWVLNRFRLVTTDLCFSYSGYIASIIIVFLKSLLRGFRGNTKVGDISAKGLIYGATRLIRSI